MQYTTALVVLAHNYSGGEDEGPTGCLTEALGRQTARGNWLHTSLVARRPDPSIDPDLTPSRLPLDRGFGRAGLVADASRLSLISDFRGKHAAF